MTIELLYLADCPHHPPAAQAVREAIGELGLTGPIVEIQIDGADQAAELGFPGSPTIRVNGQDVEPGVGAGTPPGICCRTYVVNGIRQGVPQREWIRDALLAAAGHAPEARG